MKKVRDGYKITELGEIPSDWNIMKLSEVAEIVMGQSPDSSSYNDTEDGVAFFQGKTEFGRINPVVKKWCNNPTKISKPLDILISVRAPVGDVNINNIEACIGRGLGAIRATSSSNYKYLYYAIQKYNNQLKKASQGSTFEAINSNDLKGLKLPIPHIDEQEKIALILSNVDEQIDNVDALIEKNKELKKGLMQTLLTKGIGHTKFKTTEIGEIPEEWNIFKLSDCATIIDSLHETPEYSESGFPMIRVVDVHGKAINTKLTNKVCETIYKKFTKKYEPKQGDIIMSRVGSYGLVSYLKDSERVCLGQNIVIITTELCKKYLFYVLSSEYVKNNIEKVTVGSSQKTLSLANINELKILIPSIKEQNKISLILSDIDEKIEKYENKKQKLEELKKGLMQQLLSGQIRVNID